MFEKAAVSNLIRDVLYTDIPDSMFDNINYYRETIFSHVYMHYKEVA